MAYPKIHEAPTTPSDHFVPILELSTAESYTPYLPDSYAFLATVHLRRT